MIKKRYQAFVSSTYEDLKEERKEVTQALLETSCFPAGMELFPASTKSQWEVIKRVIDESDIYIVVIAGRYGSVGTDEAGNKISYTEMEFDYALKTGKPIIALIHGDINTLPGNRIERSTRACNSLEKFRKKAMRGRLVRFWTNKDNLKSAALAAINALKEDEDNELKGWIPCEYDIEELADQLLTVKETLKKRTLELKNEKKLNNNENEENERLRKEKAQILDYVYRLEHQILKSNHELHSQDSILIREEVEKNVKDRLRRKIRCYEDEYAINYIENVNQDEPLIAHNIPEAREYAYETLSDEEKAEAKNYGLL